MARSDNGRKLRKQLIAISKEVAEALPRAALRGGTIIETGAKQNLVDKGHVVTGTLLRDIKAGLGKVTRTSAEALIGTAVHYGKYVEALPDGGFLFESSEENTPKALREAGIVIEEAMREGARAA